MNGYVTAGYIISIGSLSAYGVTLSARVRAARVRAGGQAVGRTAPDRDISDLGVDTERRADPGGGE